MRYLPLTEKDREEMRKSIGIKETKELFSDIPQDKAFYSLEGLPSALSEPELIKTFRELSLKNTYEDYTSFLGGGVYQHYCPEVVNYISGRGEFLTPYTPYQPEVSQGSLQAMFEYQTMMAMLTGMDVCNSSLYDGGTGAAEGVMLALRKARKKNRFLIAKNLHPEHIEVLETYVRNLEYKLDYVEFDKETGKLDLEDLKNKIDDNTGGILFQSPNFLGVIEEGDKISETAHDAGIYSVQVVSEAMSLVYLTPPAENGVDIVVGEAQSFGIPLGFGGPLLGFMGAKKEFMRQMPGRLVGETIDSEGNRGYVLTLSTREQHIKRERATSNICTNQAWCALRAAMYLATMGKQGLTETAKTNHLNTAYFVKQVANSSKVKVKYQKDYYNEVVVEVLGGDVDSLLKQLEAKKILAGIPLKWFYKDYENCILINLTEIHQKSDIDQLVAELGGAQ